MREKIEYLLKSNKFVQRIYIIIMSSLFRLISLFIKVKKNRVLLNGHGKRYNDSPKAIFNIMKNDERYKNYEFYWAVKNPLETVIEGAKIIKHDSLKYFLIALSSKIWISSVNIERGLRFKRKSTIYLNTWHGIPLKYVGNKVSKRRDFNFSHIDIFCASSEYDKKIYIDDFNVKEENIILSGLPRNDELYETNQNEIDKIKDALKLPINKKIILYAPTWRDKKKINDETILKTPIDIKVWKNRLKDQYIILFRAHNYTSKYLGIEFDDFVIDVSKIEDINQLLKISDILISDYSATIIDFSILNKPILCFGYDYEEYYKDRGMYVDLNQILPYGVISDQHELLNKIVQINSYDISKVRLLKERFIKNGSNAIEMCLQEIKRKEDMK